MPLHIPLELEAGAAGAGFVVGPAKDDHERVSDGVVELAVVGLEHARRSGEKRVQHCLDLGLGRSLREGG